LFNNNKTKQQNNKTTKQTTPQIILTTIVSRNLCSNNTVAMTLKEGIEFDSQDPIIFRSQKVEEVLAEVRKNRAVLIRATPTSGKTGMRQLIEKKLKDEGQTVHVLTFLRLERDATEEKFDAKACSLSHHR